MDQVTYPGPPLLFHIRINSLFLTMTIIDASMFLFAVESTLANGVGGMVLFATEVCSSCQICTPAQRITVCDLDGQRTECYGEVHTQQFRLPQSKSPGWRECTSMG